MRCPRGALAKLSRGHVVTPASKFECFLFVFWMAVVHLEARWHVPYDRLLARLRHFVSFFFKCNRKRTISTSSRAILVSFARVSRTSTLLCRRKQLKALIGIKFSACKRTGSTHTSPAGTKSILLNSFAEVYVARKRANLRVCHRRHSHHHSFKQLCSVHNGVRRLD